MFYFVDKLSSSVYITLFRTSDLASRYYVLTLIDVIALGSIMAYWLLLFVFWHTHIGGCILLAPSRINTVTFGSYDGNPVSNTPPGPARASYWSKNSNRHVFAFMISVFASLLIGNIYSRLIVVIGILAWSRFSWRNFVYDPSVELGTNDQQAVYVHTSALRVLRIRKEKRFKLLGKLEETTKCLS
jgi:hypothetical protein